MSSGSKAGLSRSERNLRERKEATGIDTRIAAARKRNETDNSDVT
ncbi:hypothetical protein [Arcanobacterium bovis]|nr:hypothetical protein [Arcanobacterium bovis]